MDFKIKEEIRKDLGAMTFEEIQKLKETLGAKVYKEALSDSKTDKSSSKKTTDFKRSNKNRPREVSSKFQVPFLGADLRTKKKTDDDIRDPRFDEKYGTFDAKSFKNNYSFLSEVRADEIEQMKSSLDEVTDQAKRKEIKKEMLRLKNKNLEEKKWQMAQATLKDEEQQVKKARAEGKTPQYVTKRERRTRELVAQFEELKKLGKLNKHLEKRRKKMVAKDRKKIGFT